jgi:Tfp pilus assembly protein PilF
MHLLVRRGIVKERLKDYTGAEQDDSDALQIDPKYPYAYKHRAVARLKQAKVLAASDD